MRLSAGKEHDEFIPFGIMSFCTIRINTGASSIPQHTTRLLFQSDTFPIDFKPISRCSCFSSGDDPAVAAKSSFHLACIDLIRDREIPEEVMLPLSEPVRERKAELLPDFSYKDMTARAKAAMRKVKAVLNDTRRFAGCGSIGNGFTMNIPALKWKSMRLVCSARLWAR